MTVAVRGSQDLVEAIDEACAILTDGARDDPARAIELALARLRTAVREGREASGSATVTAALQVENAHLREQLANAQRELRNRDDFLAVVTHELRNPLTPIAFTVGLLLSEASQGKVPSGDVLLRRLKVLNRQIGRLTSDLNRLLDFSRVRSGRLELRIEEVDLAQIVEEVLDEMKPQFETSRCELRVSCVKPQHGRWDAMRLRQVVWNLLSNAAKFGAGAPIDVHLAGGADEIRLTVCDRGPGIAEEERERVFHRFERTASGTLRSGFGVGLWLVKQIVEALGGTVHLDSAPGRGSVFTIALPRSANG